MKQTKLITTMCLILVLGLAAIASAADAEKRIMVFGDSNSFGWTTDDKGVVGRLPRNVAWPGRMAELLGSDYEVVVEALGGRTTTIDCPAQSGSGVIPGAGMNGAAYLPAALSSHMPLDMVIIMLGTNDLRKDHQRSASDIAQGVGTLVSIVSKGEWQRNTGFAVPKVLVLSPPKLDIQHGRFKTFFEGSRAKSEALPGLLRTVAENAGASFFDAATVVPFGQAPDEIHLTPANHAVLAQAVAEEVKKAFGISPVGKAAETTPH